MRTLSEYELEFVSGGLEDIATDSGGTDGGGDAGGGDFGGGDSGGGDAGGGSYVGDPGSFAVASGTSVTAAGSNAAAPVVFTNNTGTNITLAGFALTGLGIAVGTLAAPEVLVIAAAITMGGVGISALGYVYDKTEGAFHK